MRVWHTMVGPQRLPFTYWVALLQAQINQLHDLERAPRPWVLHLFTRRQSWKEAAAIFSMSNKHNATGHHRLTPRLSVFVARGRPLRRSERTFAAAGFLVLLTCKNLQTWAWISNHSVVEVWRSPVWSVTPNVSLTCHLQSVRRQTPKSSLQIPCSFLKFGKHGKLSKRNGYFPSWVLY